MEQRVAWRTSSRTQGQGQCVEIGFGTGCVVVRDTKDRGGGQLTLSWQRWHDFLSWVKRTGAE